MLTYSQHGEIPKMSKNGFKENTRYQIQKHSQMEKSIVTLALEH